MRRPAADTLLALSVALGALVLYGRTLAPGVVALNDDTLEFQLVAQRGAIPHPTGYPLFAMLLTLAARVLPWGGVAFRANALSALAAAVAVGLTFGVARRLGQGRLAATFAAALFALTPTFWAQATVAEVYGLHMALVAALIFSIFDLGFRIERPTNQGRTSSSNLPSPLLSSLLSPFLLGLGLTHHRTILLWVPALAGYAAWAWHQSGRPWLRVREGVWMVAALLLPLLLYAWLPLRAQVGSIDGTYGEVGFGCWVTACQYEGFFGGEGRPLAFFGQLTGENLGGAGIVLALLGMWYGFRIRSRWLMLMGGVLANAGFAVLYHVPDPEVFWLPVLWGGALLAGWGVQAGWEGARKLGQGEHPARLLGTALLFAGLVWQGVATFPRADRNVLTGAPTLNGEPLNGRDVLTQPLPENGVIVGLLGEITYLRYLQEAEGVSPTIATAGGDSEAQRQRAVEQALAAGQRPFLTRPLAGIEAQGALSALGPLVEVQREPLHTVPAGLWPMEQPVTPALTLAAWSRAPITGDSRERLTLAWRVVAAVPEPLHVSLRLVQPDEAPACTEGCQVDRPPLRAALPTDSWPPGTVLLDTYEVAPLPPGAHFLLILYRPSDGSEVGRVGWSP